MEEDKIECPKCKGCGKINPPKKKMISSDPNLKWCIKCKQFLSRTDNFYSSTGYCKKCHNTKQRKRIHKFDHECKACGVKFQGRRYQLYCTRKCNCAAMNKKKVFNVYDKLPNELRDQFIKDLEDK